MLPRFTVAASDRMTHYGPLVALGFFVRQQDLLAPLRSRLQFDGPPHCAQPAEVLIDMLVGLLAGCEVVAQVNTAIRPDALLAHAWGRRRFAEQSTIARTLGACGPGQVEQAAAANAAFWRHTSRIGTPLGPDQRLLVDIDLTGLPASAQAEASTAGYFSGKKTSPGANSPASAPLPIAKSCIRSSGPATRRVVWPSNRPS